MKRFVQALGQRYDGHPDIAFLDIRSYGNWGEGHIGMLQAPGIILTPPENLKNNYFLPYFNAFHHTQLIIPWGSDSYSSVYDWAVAQGAGMRRDGILSQWSKDGSECLRAHGRHPAVFEYCDGYAEMKKSGWWKPEMLRNTYFQGGKPSYMQWDPKIFEENREFCLSLGNYVGYHFVLEKAILPTSFRPSVPFQVELDWLNDGVAYLYEPCHVAIALLDARTTSRRNTGSPRATRSVGRPAEARPRLSMSHSVPFPPAGIRLPSGSSWIAARRIPPTGWEFKAARPTAGMSCTIDWSASHDFPSARGRWMAGDASPGPVEGNRSRGTVPIFAAEGIAFVELAVFAAKMGLSPSALARGGLACGHGLL